MKHLLLTTIAAVLLLGCGPRMDIWMAAEQGDIKAVKQHLAAGADVNGYTPLEWAIVNKDTETVELLRNHGGKTGEEIKAEGA